jgi:predicted ATPase
LDDTPRQLIDAAAVIGRSFDLHTLREASGRSEFETISGLEKLLSLGLILERREFASSDEISYDFTHEKLRALAYEQSSLARRRLLHRRVAEALANSPRSRRDLGALAGLIAGHYLQAGQDAQAAPYFKLAGEHARSLYANREAIGHFQSALAAGHPEAAELHEAIGDLHLLSGEYHAALTRFDTAAALYPSSGLASVEHKLGEAHARLGEWEMAECHFQAALQASGSPGDFAWQAQVYADWSRAAHQRGQAGQAQELAHQSLKMAETSQDRRSLAQAHNILGMLARSRGDFEQACQHLERSLEIAEALGEPGLRAAALNNLALFYSASGAQDRAIALAEAALEVCRQQGDRHREAALLNNLADLYHSAGQEEKAMAHLTKAVVIFTEIGIEASDREEVLNPEIWKLTEW